MLAQSLVHTDPNAKTTIRNNPGMPVLVTTTVTAGSLAAQPQPSLTAGSGVLLRPWSLDDAEAVMDAYQDEAIQRWHVMRADSLAETRDWIAGWQGGWAEETHAIWAVVDAENDTLLGRAGLKHLKFSDGTADVTYWTVPAARGKGVCSAGGQRDGILGFRGRLPPARPRTRGRQHGLVPGGREDRLRRRGRAPERMAPGRRPVRRPRARSPARLRARQTRAAQAATPPAPPTPKRSPPAPARSTPQTHGTAGTIPARHPLPAPTEATAAAPGSQTECRSATGSAAPPPAPTLPPHARTSREIIVAT